MVCTVWWEVRLEAVNPSGNCPLAVALVTLWCHMPFRPPRLCASTPPSLRFFLTGSKDMSLRLYSVDPIPGFVPITLSGHRSTIVAGHFSESGDTIYSVSKDGAVFTWVWTKRATLPAALVGAIAEADGSGSSSDDDSEAGGAPAGAGAGAGTSSKAAAAIARRHRFQAVPDPTRGASAESFSVLSGEWRLTNKHFFKQDNAKVGAGGGLLERMVEREGLAAFTMSIWRLRCGRCIPQPSTPAVAP